MKNSINYAAPIQARSHYFRDELDQRTHVETSLTISGRYRAVVITADDDAKDYVCYGFGLTRMEAIADLYESIQMSRDQVRDEEQA